MIKFPTGASIRVMKRSWTILATAFLLLAGAAITADEPADTIRLDDETVAAIYALDHLDGAPLPASLDGRVVVVTFFASWCPPCHVEFRQLEKIHAAYADRGVTVIAFNIFEATGRFADSGDRLSQFLDRYQPEYPILVADDRIAQLFGDVRRIPTVTVFGRDGHPRLHFIHQRNSNQTNPDLEALHAAIREAL